MSEASGEPGHFHGAAHDATPAHGSFRGYVTGFILSVILTAIPFWMVMTHALDQSSTVLIILALAAVQIVVHMVYFLHMTPKAEGGWSLMALIFTVTIVGIALTGSIWVMYHLNANMMPMAEQMQQMG
jgi:cytochrome o ubiquinol oxidase subunit IV